MLDAEDIPVYIRDCVQRESKLTPWEQSFIQSISEQHERTGSLSPKQQETLEQIWDKVT